MNWIIQANFRLVVFWCRVVSSQLGESWYSCPGHHHKCGAHGWVHAVVIVLPSYCIRHLYPMRFNILQIRSMHSLLGIAGYRQLVNWEVVFKKKMNAAHFWVQTTSSTSVKQVQFKYVSSHDSKNICCTKFVLQGPTFTKLFTFSVFDCIYEVRYLQRYHKGPSRNRKVLPKHPQRD